VVEDEDGVRTLADDRPQPHDVRRVQGAQQRGLAAQRLDGCRVRTRVEALERDGLTGRQLAGPPHLTGGAEADERDDVVAGKGPHLAHRRSLPEPGGPGCFSTPRLTAMSGTA
jgi:hypothetical protein